MPFVAFLGCDGSGKSSVIGGVAESLQKSGWHVRHGHWRPRPFGCSRTGMQAPSDDPHGLRPRGRVSSVLKLGWLWTNWWIAWLLGLRASSRNGIVLYDRYHADLLVDPRRYRYGGPLCLARLASRCMPQPDLVIFLDAPVEILLSRKQEVAKVTLETSRGAYLALATHNPRIRIIDASQPLQHVVGSVVNLIERDRQDPPIPR